MHTREREREKTETVTNQKDLIMCRVTINSVQTIKHLTRLNLLQMIASPDTPMEHCVVSPRKRVVGNRFLVEI